MREYMRRRGGIPVKGVLIDCARCGKRTEKQHAAHLWCAECVKPAQLERRRARNASKGAISIGKELTCKHCGAAFSKTHKRQFYCVTCAVLSANSSLPNSRKVANERQKLYNKQRRQLNPSIDISERMTAQIGLALRQRKAGRTWESIVGYTLTELMGHLERQFMPGMNWVNRTNWHIDHIVPLASFNFSVIDDSDVRGAWALSNLRPLWAVENIKKRDKRTHLL